MCLASILGIHTGRRELTATHGPWYISTIPTPQFTVIHNNFFKKKKIRTVSHCVVLASLERTM